jgi:hypothetical protein
MRHVVLGDEIVRTKRQNLPLPNGYIFFSNALMNSGADGLVISRGYAE